MPFLTDNVSLVDLVRKYSWTLLQLLNVDHDFSKADPKSSQQNNGYITAHNFVKNLNVANDALEYALNTLKARRTIYSYFDFGLKNSSFQLPYQHHSFSADCAKELFKG